MSAKTLISRRFSALFSIAMILAVLVGSAAFPTSVYAASITVTTSADNTTLDGQCSLSAPGCLVSSSRRENHVH